MREWMDGSVGVDSNSLPLHGREPSYWGSSACPDRNLCEVGRFWVIALWSQTLFACPPMRRCPRTCGSKRPKAIPEVPQGGTPIGSGMDITRSISAPIGCRGPCQIHPETDPLGKMRGCPRDGRDRPEVAHGARPSSGSMYSQSLASEVQQPVKTVERPGRNDPCPCGSGRKWRTVTAPLRDAPSGRTCGAIRGSFGPWRECAWRR